MTTWSRGVEWGEPARVHPRSMLKLLLWVMLMLKRRRRGEGVELMLLRGMRLLSAMLLLLKLQG